LDLNVEGRPGRLKQHVTPEAVLNKLDDLSELLTATELFK
jgi:hypothetical protein